MGMFAAPAAAPQAGMMGGMMAQPGAMPQVRLIICHRFDRSSL